VKYSSAAPKQIDILIYYQDDFLWIIFSYVDLREVFFYAYAYSSSFFCVFFPQGI